MDLVDIIEEQKLVCEQYGSAYRAMKLTDQVAIAIHTLDQEPIIGLRKKPDPSDNVAWFIYGGELQEDENFFEIVDIEKLHDIFSEALAFLALDEGYRFMIDKDEYEDVWHELQASE